VDPVDAQKVARFKKVFIAIGCQWFGPPVLRFEGRLLDGAARLAALKALAVETRDLPTFAAETPRQAARALFYAGEHERLVALFASRLSLGADTKAERDMLSAQLLVTDARSLWPFLQGRSRARGETREMARQRHIRKRAKVALRGLVQLYHRANETQSPVDVESMGRLLEPWL